MPFLLLEATAITADSLEANCFQVKLEVGKVEAGFVIETDFVIDFFEVGFFLFFEVVLFTTINANIGAGQNPE